MKHKSLMFVLGTLGAVAIVLGATGQAFAEGPQPPVEGNHPLLGSGPWGRRGLRGGLARGLGGFSLVDATAEATGLSVDEVIAALRDGQTFAEIAAAEGVDSQAILEAFLAEREARLEEAVGEGRLTQEQAEEMLETMAEHVSERLEQPWSPSPLGGGQLGRGTCGWGGAPGTGPGPRPFSPSQ